MNLKNNSSLDHHSKLTWVEKRGRVMEQGRSPLLIIFGAIAFFANGNRLRGEIVPQSIIIWPAGLKQPLNELATTGPRRGRPRRNADEWSFLPEFFLPLELPPDYHDYHGSFNADLFENCSIISVKPFSRLMVTALSIWTAPNIIGAGV